MKFRKKPLVIEAWHWLFNSGQEKDPTWVIDAMAKWPAPGGLSFEPYHADGPRFSIATLDAIAIALPGDYIIKGVEGELYPCKPNIFDATYDKA